MFIEKFSYWMGNIYCYLGLLRMSLIRCRMFSLTGAVKSNPSGPKISWVLLLTVP